MKSTLIISTYKSPHFLNCVLESVKRQTHTPCEVIVTEDGLFEENTKLLNSWRNKLPFPLEHLTQKDIGNRKPLALNKAILKAKGEYLVFIDGDCVLRNDFLKAHDQLKNELCFLTGRRVELSEKASRILTPELVAKGYLDRWPFALFMDSLFGKTEYLSRFFRTPFGLRSWLGQDKVEDIRGCNFSVHKKNIVAINGFSNHFSGAYGEDSDVELRLKFLGLQMKSVRGAAIQYHLWHKTQTKDENNQMLLNEVAKSRNPRTLNGLEEANSID